MFGFLIYSPGVAADESERPVRCAVRKDPCDHGAELRAVLRGRAPSEAQHDRGEGRPRASRAAVVEGLRPRRTAGVQGRPSRHSRPAASLEGRRTASVQGRARRPADAARRQDAPWVRANACLASTVVP